MESKRGANHEQKLQSLCNRLAVAISKGSEMQILKKCEIILSDAKKENLLESLAKTRFKVTPSFYNNEEKRYIEEEITGTPLEICFAIARKHPFQNYDKLAQILLQAGSQSVLPAMKAAIQAGHYPQMRFLFQNFFISQLNAGFAHFGMQNCPPIIAKIVRDYVVWGSPSTNPKDAKDDKEIPNALIEMSNIAQNNLSHRTRAILIENGAKFLDKEAMTLGVDAWFRSEEANAGHQLTLFEWTLIEGSLQNAANIFIQTEGNVLARPEILKHRREYHDPDFEYKASYDGTIFIREQGKTILHVLAANPRFEEKHCQRLLNLWHDAKIELKNNPDQQRHLAVFKRAINQLDPAGYTPIMYAIAALNGRVASFLHRESTEEFPAEQRGLQSLKKLAELFKNIFKVRDLPLAVRFLEIFFHDFLELGIAKQVLGEKLGLPYGPDAGETFFQLILKDANMAVLHWYISLLLPPLPEEQAKNEPQTSVAAAQESKTVDDEIREEPSDLIGELLLQLSVMASESKFAYVQKFLQSARRLGSFTQRSDLLKTICNLKDEQGYTVLMHIIATEKPDDAKFYCQQSGKSLIAIGKEILAIPDFACAINFFATFADPTLTRTCLGRNLGTDLFDKKTGKSLLNFILESCSENKLKWYLSTLLSSQNEEKEIKEEKDEKEAHSEAKRKPERPSATPLAESNAIVQYLIAQFAELNETNLGAAHRFLQDMHEIKPEFCRLPQVLAIARADNHSLIMRALSGNKCSAIYGFFLLELTGRSPAEILQDMFNVGDIQLAYTFLHQLLTNHLEVQPHSKLKFLAPFLKTFSDPNAARKFLGPELGMQTSDKTTGKSLFRVILESPEPFSDNILYWYFTALLTPTLDVTAAKFKEHMETFFQGSIQFLVSQLEELYDGGRVPRMGLRKVLQPNPKAAEKFLRFTQDSHIRLLVPKFSQHPVVLKYFYRLKDDKSYTEIMHDLNTGRFLHVREILKVTGISHVEVLRDIFAVKDLTLAIKFLNAFLQNLKDQREIRELITKNIELINQQTNKSLLSMILETSNDELLKWYIAILLPAPVETKEADTAHASVEFPEKSIKHLFENFNKLSWASKLTLLSAIDEAAPRIHTHPWIQNFFAAKNDRGYTPIMQAAMACKGGFATLPVLLKFSKPPAQILQDIFFTKNLILAVLFLRDLLSRATNSPAHPSFLEAFLQNLNNPIDARKFLRQDLGMQVLDNSSHRSLMHMISAMGGGALLEWYLKALLAQPSPAESKELAETSAQIEKYIITELSELFNAIEIDHEGHRVAISNALPAESKRGVILKPDFKAAEKLLACIQKIAPELLQQPQIQSMHQIMMIMRALEAEQFDLARKLLADQSYTEVLRVISTSRNSALFLKFIEAFLPKLQTVSHDDHLTKTIQAFINKETIMQLLQKQPLNIELVNFLVSQGVELPTYALTAIIESPSNSTTPQDKKNSEQERIKAATQLLRHAKKPFHDHGQTRFLLFKLATHYWSSAGIELAAELIAQEGVDLEALFQQGVLQHVNKRSDKGDFLLAQKSLLEKPDTLDSLRKIYPQLGEQILWPLKNADQKESKESAKTVFDVALEIGEKSFAAVLRLHLDCHSDSNNFNFRIYRVSSKRKAALNLYRHGANALLSAIEKGIINPETGSECYKLLADDCDFFWGDNPKFLEQGSPSAAGSLLLIDAIKRESAFALEMLLKMQVNDDPSLPAGDSHTLIFYLLEHYAERYDDSQFLAKKKCLLEHCKRFDTGSFLDGNPTIIYALKQHQEELIIEMLARGAPLSKRGLIYLAQQACNDGKLFLELLREKSQAMRAEQKAEVAQKTKAGIEIRDPYAHFLREANATEKGQPKWEESRLLVNIYLAFIQGKTDRAQIKRAENLIIELLTEGFSLDATIAEQLLLHKREDGLPFLEMLREKSDLTASAEHKGEHKIDGEQKAIANTERTDLFAKFLNQARAAVGTKLLWLILNAYIPNSRKELGDLFDQDRWPLSQQDFNANNFDPIAFVLTHKCFDMVPPLINKGIELCPKIYIELMRTPELKGTPFCKLAGYFEDGKKTDDHFNFAIRSVTSKEPIESDYKAFDHAIHLLESKVELSKETLVIFFTNEFKIPNSKDHSSKPILQLLFERAQTPDAFIHLLRSLMKLFGNDAIKMLLNEFFVSTVQVKKGWFIFANPEPGLRSSNPIIALMLSEKGAEYISRLLNDECCSMLLDEKLAAECKKFFYGHPPIVLNPAEKDQVASWIKSFESKKSVEIDEKAVKAVEVAINASRRFDVREEKKSDAAVLVSVSPVAFMPRVSAVPQNPSSPGASESKAAVADGSSSHGSAPSRPATPPR